MFRRKTEGNLEDNTRFGWSTVTSRQILSSEISLKYPLYKVEFLGVMPSVASSAKCVTASSRPAPQLVTCHREVRRLRLIHQPLIFYNLPFFSMSQKMLLLFSKSSAAHHKDKTETAKGCGSQSSFISSQHHAEEKLCLAPQRSMGIWQFVAVTPGPLPLFHGLWSSKKTKHHHPRMQKQAAIVFFK